MSTQFFLENVLQYAKDYAKSLDLVRSLAKSLDKDQEDMAELSKKIAAATTMSQEESAYYLAGKLMECAQTGEDLDIEFEY